MARRRDLSHCRATYRSSAETKIHLIFFNTNVIVIAVIDVLDEETRPPRPPPPHVIPNAGTARTVFIKPEFQRDRHPTVYVECPAVSWSRV